MSWKKKVFENFRLYAITDLCGEDPEIFQKVEAAYRGGADIVQLRSKTLSDASLYRLGLGFRKIADRFHKLFFVNDRPDLALAVEADGVHLGEEDLPLQEVRKIVAARRLFIGKSTHSLTQALQAEKEGADYIGVGPIFETPTKPAYKPVGLDLIREVKKQVRIPFVCIGGIDSNNIDQVIQAGAERVAVVRAVFGTVDVEEAAKELRQGLDVGATRASPLQRGQQPPMTTQYPLAVIGTVAIDGVETPFGKRERVFGGSASYFSYAASFFSPVSLVAVVGKDFPEEFQRILEERPIDLSHLEQTDGKTFYWRGKYEFDMNSAETLETQLNVLTEFSPKVRFQTFPDYLFLANIDPELQMQVIEQAGRPRAKFVACDTMNFWIANKRPELLKILAHVDLVVINENEARQLAGETNLVHAAQKIHDWGPSKVVIKKGEHGALVFDEGHFFALPGYPLETVFDPTGAGDSFAGAMMGYLAKTNDVSFENLKRAVAYGAVVASFTVEQFSLDRLRSLDLNQIEERLKIFRKICSF